MRTRGVEPRLVTDPAEITEVSSLVRTSVLAKCAHLPAERALYAALVVDNRLQYATFSVVTDDGPVAAHFGAAAQVIWVPEGRIALVPAHTHDRFAGAKVNGWSIVPNPACAPPLWARAPLPMPASLDELYEQFAAACTPIAERGDRPAGVRVHTDVVVPPAWGAAALRIEVPKEVSVRALAGTAGHHEFVRATS